MPIVYGTGQPAPWLKRKIEQSKATIEQWLEYCEFKVYGSISGGKDSLVMASLIRSVYPNCPFVWVNQGHLAEWQDCIELLYHLKEQGWNIVEICPPLGLIQLFRKYGMAFDGQFTALDRKHIEELLLKPLSEYCELNAIQGYAWGLRRESRGRTLYLRSKGELYQRKDGVWVCSPVGFWTTQDIWCYIDSQKLPYAEVYDRYGRDTFRNGCPIDTALSNWGKLTWLKRHEPEVFDEFCSYFPEVRNYA